MDKGFSKYLVIFIDILGSKSRHDFFELYQIHSIFHGELAENQRNDMSHTVYFRRIYSFSDCAYIFYGFKPGIEESRKDEGSLFRVALCNTEPLLIKFIESGFIFRGGIYYGDAYVDSAKSMFFGDAINKAYLMESEDAEYPRILVDDYVAEVVLEKIDEVKYKNVIRDKKDIPFIASGLMPYMPETADGIIKTDTDGRYYFNFLQWLDVGNPIGRANFAEKAMERWLKEVEIQADEKVKDKYWYLIDKLGEV